MDNILPHKVDVFTPARVAPLGQKFCLGDGRIFRYVQFKDAVTYAAGQSVTWDDKNTWAVTNDESSAEIDNILAGVVAGAPAEDEYGLIQTHGLYESANKTPGDDTIAPGTIMIFDDATPTDGSMISYTAASASAGNPSDAELLALIGHMGGGYAVASDTSNDTADTVDVFLRCE